MHVCACIFSGDFKPWTMVSRVDQIINLNVEYL